MRRGIRTLLRAAHILTGGVLVGGHVFAVAHAELHVWWLLTLISGLALLLTDLHASCAFLLEGRGAAVLLKLLLLFLIPVSGDWAVPLLVLVLVIGAISSHLPRHYRHRLLFPVNHIRADNRHG